MSMRRAAIRAIGAVTVCGLLAACGGQPTPDGQFVVADVFATQGKTLATLELSPTPLPSATFANIAPPTAQPTLPLPTVVVLRQPTQPLGPPGGTLPPGVAATTSPEALSCAAEPTLPFAAIWTNVAQAKAMMRCPQGSMQSFNGVWQAFERGAMFWRESDKTIFVISDAATRQGQATDKWWHMPDTWADGEPESDPGLSPPAGLRQPVRGFGKVWQANGFVRGAIGWAISDETPVSIAWQVFDGGWMMTGPNGTPIYVMVPLDAAPYTNGVHLAPQQ
jgi:hypothetical protein